MDQKKIGLIIPASGSGQRMGKKEKKQFLKLKGRTLLEITLENLMTGYPFDEVVIVCPQEDKKRVADLVGALIESKAYSKEKFFIVSGGASRQASVYNGLSQLSEDIESVLIHDGARPFIKKTAILRVIEALEENPVVTLGLQETDSVCRVEGDKVIEPLDRTNIYKVQTPQGFKKDLLLLGHEKAKAEGYQGTDDCSLCHLLGYETKVVLGHEENIKVTRPMDLMIAEALLEGGIE